MLGICHRPFPCSCNDKQQQRAERRADRTGQVHGRRSARLQQIAVQQIAEHAGKSGEDNRQNALPGRAQFLRHDPHHELHRRHVQETEGQALQYLHAHHHGRDREHELDAPTQNIGECSEKHRFFHTEESDDIRRQEHGGNIGESGNHQGDARPLVAAARHLKDHHKIGVKRSQRLIDEQAGQQKQQHRLIVQQPGQSAGEALGLDLDLRLLGKAKNDENSDYGKQEKRDAQILRRIGRNERPCNIAAERVPDALEAADRSIR
ncbi:hypothetical protein D3C71_1250880 [compost metagenome]